MASTTKRAKEGDPNDPLDPLDFKIPGSVLSLTPTREQRSFTITTDSYISLCSRVYEALCANKSGFAATIPESAFQYYAVILLWRRFAEILPISVRSGSKFIDKLPQLDKSDYYIPSPLKTYLKGIGHYCDPDNCDRKFVLPPFPVNEEFLGIPHTFGKVDHKTHVLYESFPAPGIAALRILADIKYTCKPCNENLIWDLPTGIRADSTYKLDSNGTTRSDPIDSKPTRNLLGWAPAQRLSTQQLELFKSLKIDNTFVQNPSSGPETGIAGLFNRISQILRPTCQNQYKHRTSKVIECNAAPSEPYSSMGSMTQGLSIEKSLKPFVFLRDELYCEGSVCVLSPYLLTDDLTKGAAIAGYRMAKEPLGELPGMNHCWSCYDFEEYMSVPESWIDTRNMVYEYGDVARLNEPIYTTPYIEKRLLQNECILHEMFDSTMKWNIYM